VLLVVVHCKEMDATESLHNDFPDEGLSSLLYVASELQCLCFGDNHWSLVRLLD